LTKHTILFLAANPLSTDRLALDEEARAIQHELERSGHRDQFELVTRWAVQPMDLLRELRRLKPTIVHFSGHGGRVPRRAGDGERREVVAGPECDGELENQLFFQGPDGGSQIVTTDALAETFGAAGGSVKLVILSACYSQAQSAALVTHIDAVIGMASAIDDATVRAFAVGFYGGLAEGESIAAALRQGCAAVGLNGLPGREMSQLMVRDDVDVERVHLVTRLGHYGTPSFRAPMDEYAASDDRQNHWDRARWVALGAGIMCLLSGGAASVASQLPVKSVLGLLGAGVIVIVLALGFERVSREQVSGPRRFIIACVVFLIIGLTSSQRVPFGAWGDGNGLRLASAPSGDAMDASAPTVGSSAIPALLPPPAEPAAADYSDKVAKITRQKRALESVVKIEEGLRGEEAVAVHRGDPSRHDSPQKGKIEDRDLFVDAKRFDEQVKTLHEEGKLLQALEPARQALSIRERRLGRSNLETLASLATLATLYDEIGLYFDAEQLYMSELHAYQDAFGSLHPGVEQTLDKLAVLYWRVDIRDPNSMLGPEDPNVPRIVDKVAALYHRQGDSATAASILENLARLYDRKGRGPAAASLRRRARELRDRTSGSSER